MNSNEIETKFINLEIKIAHLEKQNEDLSEVLYKIQLHADKLQNEIDLLSKKLNSQSSGELEIRGNEKPPHY